MAKAQVRDTAEGAVALRKVAALLGGTRVLKHEVSGQLDAHEMIVRGLPARALSHLIGELIVMEPTTSLENAIGISLRTFQRRRAMPSKPLSTEQSSRTWKFAEILSKATTIFGSQEEAEQWLERPAIGLNQRRPIDLLASSAGLELVEDHLVRLEYGVYS